MMSMTDTELRVFADGLRTKLAREWDGGRPGQILDLALLGRCYKEATIRALSLAPMTQHEQLRLF